MDIWICKCRVMTGCRLLPPLVQGVRGIGGIPSRSLSPRTQSLQLSPPLPSLYCHLIVSLWQRLAAGRSATCVFFSSFSRVPVPESHPQTLSVTKRPWWLCGYPPSMRIKLSRRSRSQLAVGLTESEPRCRKKPPRSARSSSNNFLDIPLPRDRKTRRIALAHRLTFNWRQTA